MSSEGMVGRLNALLARNRDLKRQLAMVEREMEAERKNLNQARYQTKKAKEHHDFVVNSKTWRASAPLRKIAGTIKRVVRR